MVRFLLIIIFSLWLYSPAHAQQIRVAVAANARFPAQLLKESFEKDTGTKVDLIISSSGQLANQIKQGAPFDIFLSADTRYPAALQQAGLTEGKPQVYAYGTLILWTTKKVDLAQGIKLVAAPNIRKIAIANPRLAPYGEAALQALAHYQLDVVAKPKIIFAESIAQVNQYVLSGAVDLGFTAQSVVLEPAMRNKGRWATLDSKSYPRVAQSAVLLKSARRRNFAQAQQFYKYLYGAKARAIFTHYGYATH